MNPKDAYIRWTEQEQLEPVLMEELVSIAKDEEAITDRFWRDLEFGTGGLRGIIGAGSNRMNIYTVGKATQGLADYLKGAFLAPSICIAYDTRNMSSEFAKTAASVLCANGVKVYLFDGVRPTPMLSFAVRHKQASGGIVITASHNPKQYNGYKVYGPDGGQITDEAAATILAKIAAADLFTDVKRMSLEKAKEEGLLTIIAEDVDAPYYEKVKALAMRKGLIAEKAAGLRILYTPLHGSGNIPVRRVLAELGYADLSVVPAQELPDGNFPTASYPNPEEPAVYALAIDMAKDIQPDLIFATDPDCDRIGVLVRDTKGDFAVLTGNQVGALLSDYVITTRKELGTLPENSAIIKTIVTTDLAALICNKHDVSIFNVLTGFKYIGEMIGRWEKDGAHTFLLGFEESYGYLAGNFVRDKDAVIASVLITEMALYYKEKGMTLYQAMENVYARYGYTGEKLISATLPGQQGQQEIAEILKNLREDYRGVFAGESLALIEDYKTSLRKHISTGKEEVINLPTSNVLKFIFTDGSWLVLRPSGTEPKIKLYLSAMGKTKKEVDDRLEALKAFCKAILPAHAQAD